MFERFTERARQVVVLAQEEARGLKHNYIGTEHILLGLLREEEGVAATVLGSLDITADGVRAEVVRIVGSGEEVTAGQIPFTPRAKKVLELALREALTLGHNYIGTEHVLLGLVRETQGVAARILLDFDADPDKIREEAIRQLGGTEAPEAVGFRPPVAEPSRPEVGAFSGIHVDLAASARSALDRAAAEALMRGRHQLDSGDLLVALASLDDDLVRAVRERLQLDPASLRDAVEEVRGGPGGGEEDDPPREAST